MPRKSFHEWESRWDGLSVSEAEKTRILFEDYLIDANRRQKYLSLIHEQRHGRAKEVRQILSLVQNNTSNDTRPSIELMLAWLKKEINSSTYHVTAECFSNNETDYINAIERYKKNILQNELFICDYQKLTLGYVVMTPKGKRIAGTITREAFENIAGDFWQYHSVRAQDIQFSDATLQAILSIIAERGHTHGYIDHTDELTTVLNLIKIKTNINYFNVQDANIITRYQRLGYLRQINAESIWTIQDNYNQHLSTSEGLLVHQQHYSRLSGNQFNSIELSTYQSERYSLKVTTYDAHTEKQLNAAIAAKGLPVPIRLTLAGKDRYDRKTKKVYEYDHYFQFHTSECDWSINYLEHKWPINDLSLFKHFFPSPTFISSFCTDQTCYLTSQQIDKLLAQVDFTPSALGTPYINYGLKEYTLVVTRSNEAKLLTLLEEITHIDPSTAIVADTIKRTLHIHYTAKIYEAIAAQQHGDYITIDKLREHYSADLYSNNPEPTWSDEELLAFLTQLYDGIIPENPYYSDAQVELIGIWGNKRDDGVDDQFVLEQQFKLALKSNIQMLMDRFFDQLCGGNGFYPAINDIKVNEDTLFNVAAALKRAKQLQQRDAQIKFINIRGNKRGYGVDDQMVLKQQFILTLKSKNPLLIDGFFDQLSGGKGFNPDICDIKVDEDTLLKVAAALKHVNQSRPINTHLSVAKGTLFANKKPVAAPRQNVAIFRMNPLNYLNPTNHTKIHPI